MSFRRHQRKGRISVHTPELIEDLVLDNERHEKEKSSFIGESRRSKSASCVYPKSIHEQAVYRPPINQSCRIQNWLNEKSVRNIQEKTNFESRATTNMYMTLLENEETFVKDVDYYLSYKSMLDRRKREMLYKKWSEQVHEPVRREITREMNGPKYPELDKRKRLLHNRYLDYRNKKGFVYLDVMSPEEYDPLVFNKQRPGPLKARTGVLNDPLIAQECVRLQEDKDIIRCVTGETFPDHEIEKIRLPPQPLVPLGRHGTECRTWLRMQLHDIDSGVRYRSRQRMIEDHNESDIDFSRYQRGEYRLESIDKELRSQRKREFLQKHLTTVDLGWPEPDILDLSRGSDESDIEQSLCASGRSSQTSLQETSPQYQSNSQTQTERCGNQDTLPIIHISQSTPVNVMC